MPEDRADPFHAFIARHYDWMVRLASRLLFGVNRDFEETRDAVHDAMVRFLESMPRIVIADDRKGRALLRTILKRHLINQAERHARRRVRSFDVTDDDGVILDLDAGSVMLADGTTPSMGYHRKLQRARVRLAISLIGNPLDRAILELREFEGLEWEAIGKELGQHPEMLRMRLRRLHRALAKTIERIRWGQIDELLAELGPDAFTDDGDSGEGPAE